MAQVDDGELEMLLDGALGLLPPERAEAVRLYAETTEEGAARLAELKRVRDRSRAILRDAGPGAVGEAPDFQEIRRRAEAGGGAGSASASLPPSGGLGTPAPPHGGRHSGVPRRVPLLWAASVAAALGVGWLGRGVLEGPGPIGSTEVAREASAPAVAAEPVVTPAPLPSTPSAPTAADAPAAGRTGSVADREEFPRAAPPPLPGEEVATDSRSPGEEPILSVLADDAVDPEGWPEGWEERTPAVAGLPLLQVESRGDTVVLLQRLPDGGGLEVRYVDGPAPPQGALPRTLAEAPARARLAPPAAATPFPQEEVAERVEASSVRVPTAEGWIELRGAAPDSLLRSWGEELARRRRP